MSSDLFVGVDVGKRRHIAALLSRELLSRSRQYQDCPTFSIEQSRASFDTFLAALRVYGKPEQTHVLLEHTGHYGFALEQFLHEHSVQVYRVHVQERPKGMAKSDKRDAQGLAVRLYNQLELDIPVVETSQRIYRLVPPEPTAVLLRGIIQHRIELVREVTQRKNKLTALAEELFPELTEVYRDPNSPSALALRKIYPLPADVAQADVSALLATRARYRPGRESLVYLQSLARETIGTRNEHRIRSAKLEQAQLITELELLQSHVEVLDREITAIVIGSRPGQILMSFPCVGAIHAATLIAYTGSISNFPHETDFRAFCGWSPTEFQSGETYDYRNLHKNGHMLLKQTVYLITIAAIRTDTKWRLLYERLVLRLCQWDARLSRYKGRMKVVGRIAGQMLGVIYTLLKQDAALLAGIAEGEDIPPPALYAPEKHRISHLRPPDEQATGD